MGDPTRPEWWVFDVDGTLVDSLTATSLRPGAREILEHLSAGPARVIWWSAGGGDYARRRAAALGVSDLVDEFHSKGGRGLDGRYLVDHFLDLHSRAIFVDDSPGDLPVDALYIAVHSYISAHRHDRGLVGVAEAAGLNPDQARSADSKPPTPRPAGDRRAGSCSRRS